MRKRAAGEVVADDGKQLVEELSKGEASKVDEFLSGHAGVDVRKETPLSPDFEKIVTRSFVLEPFEAYQRLEATLKLGEKRDDRGSAFKGLDEAESCQREAHKLWATCIRERARWEKDNEVVHGAMRLRATEVLQQEKAQGLRNKQITDPDVESMAATMFPDQWSAQEVRRAEVKAMEESTRNLAELWMKRIQTLQTLLTKQR
jgi:hypothetical protein